MKSLYWKIFNFLSFKLRKLDVFEKSLVKHKQNHDKASWFYSLFFTLDEMLDSSYPWWTYSSVDFVEKYLATKSAARVFEWGSGGSSLWLANRCASVVSVEHDENWMPKMVDRLPVNAEIRFVKPEMNQNQHFSSKKHGWKNLNFENYVNSVSQEADKFDLIVIDGRSRVACLSRALENLSSGGMILFDNVQRLRYLRSVLKVDSSVFHRKLFFGRTPCSLLPTFTAVFIKKY